MNHASLDLTFASDIDFSDPPSDLDDMDLDVDGEVSETAPRPLKKKSRMVVRVNSKLEEFPTEILNQIVADLPDPDLKNLTYSSPVFAECLAPATSAIWKTRFLSRYDYPLLAETVEFAYAYQLRRYVFREFVEFSDPADLRLVVQLEVLRDMIIEAYTPSKSHLPAPLMSRNLAAFASPHNSPWIIKFLSCFLFPKSNKRFGQPHLLFDAMQLILSHLLLSPASQMAHVIKSSRANYDLAVVYAWDQQFTPLYQKSSRVEVAPETARSQPSGRRSKRLKPHATPKPEPAYVLNTHALLHIRNFWHRHLIEEPRGFASTSISENTYGKMAKALMRARIVPRKWETPLQDGDLRIETTWYGHYSTLNSWARKRQELEEVQSVAEDWDKVDPLKLDFDISLNNTEDGFWPPIFRDIPVFQKTIPSLDSGSCVFLRGLASFVELNSDSSSDKKNRSMPSGSQATLSLPTTPQLPKYHPFLAMRLRGIIHSIPAQPQSASPEGKDWSIPGWRRIVMLLFKPSKRHLIQVLEHADEEFGDPFTTAVTSQLTQNGTATASNNVNTAQQLLNGTNAGGQALDPAELDAQLDAYLRNKLASSDQWRDGSQLGKDTIEEMEEKFRLSEYLDWNDIDYAYAYEGVVLPGGKIMMGRYWRVAMNGEGDGMEWSDALGDLDDQEDDVAAAAAANNADAMELDGDTIVVGGGGGGGGTAQNETETPASASASASANGTGPGTGTGNGRARYKKLERGPFVFWC